MFKLLIVLIYDIQITSMTLLVRFPLFLFSPGSHPRSGSGGPNTAASNNRHGHYGKGNNDSYGNNRGSNGPGMNYNHHGDDDSCSPNTRAKRMANMLTTREGTADVGMRFETGINGTFGPETHLDKHMGMNSQYNTDIRQNMMHQYVHGPSHMISNNSSGGNSNSGCGPPPGYPGPNRGGNNQNNVQNQMQNNNFRQKGGNQIQNQNNSNRRQTPGSRNRNGSRGRGSSGEIQFQGQRGNQSMNQMNMSHNKMNQNQMHNNQNFHSHTTITNSHSQNFSITMAYPTLDILKNIGKAFSPLTLTLRKLPVPLFAMEERSIVAKLALLLQNSPLLRNIVHKDSLRVDVIIKEPAKRHCADVDKPGSSKVIASARLSKMEQIVGGVRVICSEEAKVAAESENAAKIGCGSKTASESTTDEAGLCGSDNEGNGTKTLRRNPNHSEGSGSQSSSSRFSKSSDNTGTCSIMTPTPLDTSDGSEKLVSSVTPCVFQVVASFRRKPAETETATNSKDTESDNKNQKTPESDSVPKETETTPDAEVQVQVVTSNEASLSETVEVEQNKTNTAPLPDSESHSDSDLITTTILDEISFEFPANERSKVGVVRFTETSGGEGGAFALLCHLELVKLLLPTVASQSAASVPGGVHSGASANMVQTVREQETARFTELQSFVLNQHPEVFYVDRAFRGEEAEEEDGVANMPFESDLIGMDNGSGNSNSKSESQSESTSHTEWPALGSNSNLNSQPHSKETCDSSVTGHSTASTSYETATISTMSMSTAMTANSIAGHSVHTTQSSHQTMLNLYGSSTTSATRRSYGKGNSNFNSSNSKSNYHGQGLGGPGISSQEPLCIEQDVTEYCIERLNKELSNPVFFNAFFGDSVKKDDYTYGSGTSGGQSQYNYNPQSNYTQNKFNQQVQNQLDCPQAGNGSALDQSITVSITSCRSCTNRCSLKAKELSQLLFEIDHEFDRFLNGDDGNTTSTADTASKSKGTSGYGNAVESQNNQSQTQQNKSSAGGRTINSSTKPICCRRVKIAYLTHLVNTWLKADKSRQRLLVERVKNNQDYPSVSDLNLDSETVSDSATEAAAGAVAETILGLDYCERGFQRYVPKSAWKVTLVRKPVGSGQNQNFQDFTSGSSYDQNQHLFQQVQNLQDWSHSNCYVTKVEYRLPSLQVSAQVQNFTAGLHVLRSIEASRAAAISASSSNSKNERSSDSTSKNCKEDGDTGSAGGSNTTAASSNTDSAGEASNTNSAIVPGPSPTSISTLTNNAELSAWHTISATESSNQNNTVTQSDQTRKLLEQAQQEVTRKIACLDDCLGHVQKCLDGTLCDRDSDDEDEALVQLNGASSIAVQQIAANCGFGLDLSMQLTKDRSVEIRKPRALILNGEKFAACRDVRLARDHEELVCGVFEERYSDCVDRDSGRVCWYSDDVDDTVSDMCCGSRQLEWDVEVVYSLGQLKKALFGCEDWTGRMSSTSRSKTSPDSRAKTKKRGRVVNNSYGPKSRPQKFDLWYYYAHTAYDNKNNGNTFRPNARPSSSAKHNGNHGSGRNQSSLSTMENNTSSSLKLGEDRINCRKFRELMDDLVASFGESCLPTLCFLLGCDMLPHGKVMESYGVPTVACPNKPSLSVVNLYGPTLLRAVVHGRTHVPGVTTVFDDHVDNNRIRNGTARHRSASGNLILKDIDAEDSQSHSITEIVSPILRSSDIKPPKSPFSRIAPNSKARHNKKKSDKSKSRKFGVSSSPNESPELALITRTPSSDSNSDSDSSNQSSVKRNNHQNSISNHKSKLFTLNNDDLFSESATVSTTACSIHCQYYTNELHLLSRTIEYRCNKIPVQKCEVRLQIETVIQKTLQLLQRVEINSNVALGDRSLACLPLTSPLLVRGAEKEFVLLSEPAGAQQSKKMAMELQLDLAPKLDKLLKKLKTSDSESGSDSDAPRGGRRRGPGSKLVLVKRGGSKHDSKDRKNSLERRSTRGNSKRNNRLTGRNRSRSRSRSRSLEHKRKRTPERKRSRTPDRRRSRSSSCGRAGKTKGSKPGQNQSQILSSPNIMINTSHSESVSSDDDRKTAKSKLIKTSSRSTSANQNQKQRSCRRDSDQTVKRSSVSGRRLSTSNTESEKNGSYTCLVVGILIAVVVVCVGLVASGAVATGGLCVLVSLLQDMFAPNSANNSQNQSMCFGLIRQRDSTGANDRESSLNSDDEHPAKRARVGGTLAGLGGGIVKNNDQFLDESNNRLSNIGQTQNPNRHHNAGIIGNGIGSAVPNVVRDAPIIAKTATYTDIYMSMAREVMSGQRSSFDLAETVQCDLMQESTTRILKNISTGFRAWSAWNTRLLRAALVYKRFCRPDRSPETGLASEAAPSSTGSGVPCWCDPEYFKLKAQGQRGQYPDRVRQIIAEHTSSPIAATEAANQLGLHLDVFYESPKNEADMELIRDHEIVSLEANDSSPSESGSTHWDSLAPDIQAAVTRIAGDISVWVRDNKNAWRSFEKLLKDKSVWTGATDPMQAIHHSMTRVDEEKFYTTSKEIEFRQYTPPPYENLNPLHASVFEQHGYYKSESGHTNMKTGFGALHKVFDKRFGRGTRERANSCSMGSQAGSPTLSFMSPSGGKQGSICMKSTTMASLVSSSTEAILNRNQLDTILKDFCPLYNPHSSTIEPFQQKSQRDGRDLKGDFDADQSQQGLPPSHGRINNLNKDPSRLGYANFNNYMKWAGILTCKVQNEMLSLSSWGNARHFASYQYFYQQTESRRDSGTWYEVTGRNVFRKQPSESESEFSSISGNIETQSQSHPVTQKPVLQGMDHLYATWNMHKWYRFWGLHQVDKNVDVKLDRWCSPARVVEKSFSEILGPFEVVSDGPAAFFLVPLTRDDLVTESETVTEGSESKLTSTILSHFNQQDLCPDNGSNGGGDAGPDSVTVSREIVEKIRIKHKALIDNMVQNLKSENEAEGGSGADDECQFHGHPLNPETRYYAGKGKYHLLLEYKTLSDKFNSKEYYALWPAIVEEGYASSEYDDISSGNRTESSSTGESSNRMLQLIKSFDPARLALDGKTTESDTVT